MDREGIAANTLFRAQPRGFGETGNEFGTAIGIAGIVQRIHTDEDVARMRSLGKGGRQCEKHEIARRDIGDGNILPHPAFGHVDIRGQRRTAELAQVQRQFDMAFYAKLFRNRAGRLELANMALPVIDGERVYFEAALARERGGHHGIESARKQHDCRTGMIVGYMRHAGQLGAGAVARKTIGSCLCDVPLPKTGRAVRRRCPGCRSGRACCLPCGYASGHSHCRGRYTGP